MTKKQIIILSLSGFGILVFFLTEFLTNQSSVLCRFIGEYNYQTTCRLVGNVTIIAFPLLISSIFLLFFINETILDDWTKFTFIYLFIAVITPWYSGDGFLNIQKEIITLILSGLYFILSILLILYKSWRLRKVDQKI